MTNLFTTAAATAASWDAYPVCPLLFQPWPRIFRSAVTFETREHIQSTKVQTDICIWGNPFKALLSHCDDEKERDGWNCLRPWQPLAWRHNRLRLVSPPALIPAIRYWVESLSSVQISAIYYLLMLINSCRWWQLSAAGLATVKIRL